MRAFRRILALGGACALLAVSAALPNAGVRGSGYNDTNPLATPCGDGSHEVETLRSNFVVSSTNLVVGRVDIRYSSFCRTVWTRTVNMTGKSGQFYASGRTLTADSYISVYRCPKSTCLVASQKETGDVLTSPNSWAVSHQLDLPPGGTISGSPQPPTIRSVGWFRTNAGTEWKHDVNRQLIWTILDNEWDDIKGGEITDGVNPTCDDVVNYCKSWGETAAGGPRSILVRLDPNLNAAPGVADLGTDMQQLIIPAFNSMNADNAPNAQVCSGTCSEQIFVTRSPDTDPEFVGADNAGVIAVTKVTGNSGLHLMVGRTIKIRASRVFDHSCGAVDDGSAPCDGPHNDDRPLLAHEFGHAYGLGHCNMYSAMMCHLQPGFGADGPYDNVEGVLHWVPQWEDVNAFKRLYP
jgi:hypothetical protein